MKITVPEAARRCGKNPETVRRWIREGKLRSEKVGTQHLVEDAELDSLADAGEVLPLPPEWERTFTGRPQPDWVRIQRRHREAH